jgi:hypothetical protein
MGLPARHWSYNRRPAGLNIAVILVNHQRDKSLKVLGVIRKSQAINKNQERGKQT